ncbi:F-box only protein 5-like [Pholidichthys leucotaenia]
MKSPPRDSTRGNSMEKNGASPKSKVLNLKDSPVKKPTPVHVKSLSVAVSRALFSTKNNASAPHGKENATGRTCDGTLEEDFEDSGYLSLHSSQVHLHHADAAEVQTLENPTAGLPCAPTGLQEASPNASPSKCQGEIFNRHLMAASTPVTHPQRKAACSLPVLEFLQEVCVELSKGYKKNGRYDWSIISIIAQKYPLDRLIGRQMGIEYVDIFANLQNRNMNCIVKDILALVGDVDLISCTTVSKTWKKIINDDPALVRRCQRAEQALRESSHCRRLKGLTRDAAVSRAVLSSVQTMATVKTPLSSPKPQRTRFSDFQEAASKLKQGESLCRCKLCGSPAKCETKYRSKFSTPETIVPGSAQSRNNVRRL